MAHLLEDVRGHLAHRRRADLVHVAIRAPLVVAAAPADLDFVRLGDALWWRGQVIRAVWSAADGVGCELAEDRLDLGARQQRAGIRRLGPGGIECLGCRHPGTAIDLERLL